MNVSAKLSETGRQIFYFALATYIMFILGRSVYKNYRINERINGLENEIIGLQIDNEKIENLILYYRTDAFKELEIRRKLGFHKPDEKVILFEAMPMESSLSSGNEREIKNKENTAAVRQNYQKWFDFLVGKK